MKNYPHWIESSLKKVSQVSDSWNFIEELSLINDSLTVNNYPEALFLVYRYKAKKIIVRITLQKPGTVGWTPAHSATGAMW